MKPITTVVDVLIVGGGPAGLSAALSLARARRSIVLFDSGVYRNDPSKHMHSLITWDHHDPSALRVSAKQELLEGRYQSVQWVPSAVTQLIKLPDGQFRATDANSTEWIGEKLVLATGVRDILPDIPGFLECWGKSIYHCLFCHGFEDAGARSAGILAFDLLSNKDMCLSLASMARQFVSEVIIYSNGSTEVAENLNQIIKSGTNLRTDTRRIVGIRPEADERVTIAFDDGSTKTHKFLVYHPRTAVNVNMATDLGLELSPSGGEIKTSPPFNETNVPGCFAVGDAGSPMKALVLALGNGSLAGPGVVQQLVKQGKFSPSGNI